MLSASVNQEDMTSCYRQRHYWVPSRLIQNFARETFVLVWFEDIGLSDWSVLIRAQPEPQTIDLNFPRVQRCSDLAFGLAHRKDRGQLQSSELEMSCWRSGELEGLFSETHTSL